MTTKMKFILVALFALFIAACSSDVSKENYNKITSDMPYEDVISILGQPNDYSEIGLGDFSGQTAVWRDDGLVIYIQFINGKVKLKNMQRLADTNAN